MVAPPRLIPPWDDGQLWRDKCRHEAGHAVAAHWLGSDLDRVVMDPHGDYGWHGSVDALPRRVRADATPPTCSPRLPTSTSRATSPPRPTARPSRRTGCGTWGPLVWEFVIEHDAGKLIKGDGFRIDHAAGHPLARAPRQAPPHRGDRCIGACNGDGARRRSRLKSGESQHDASATWISRIGGG